MLTCFQAVGLPPSEFSSPKVEEALLASASQQQPPGAAGALACPQCGTLFKGRLNKYSLLRHMRNLHWTHLRLNPCAICGQNFNRKDSLDRHMISKHGPRSPVSEKPPQGDGGAFEGGDGGGLLWPLPQPDEGEEGSLLQYQLEIPLMIQKNYYDARKDDP